MHVSCGAWYTGCCQAPALIMARPLSADWPATSGCPFKGHLKKAEAERPSAHSLH